MITAGTDCGRLSCWIAVTECTVVVLGTLVVIVLSATGHEWTGRLLPWVFGAGAVANAVGIWLAMRSFGSDTVSVGLTGLLLNIAFGVLAVIACALSIGPHGIPM